MVFGRHHFPAISNVSDTGSKTSVFVIFFAQNDRKVCFTSEIMSKYVNRCLQIRKKGFKFFSDNAGHNIWHI